MISQHFQYVFNSFFRDMYLLKCWSSFVWIHLNYFQVSLFFFFFKVYTFVLPFWELKALQTVDEILLGISMDNLPTITDVFLDFGWVLTGEMFFSRSVRAASSGNVLKKSSSSFDVHMTYVSLQDRSFGSQVRMNILRTSGSVWHTFVLRLNLHL